MKKVFKYFILLSLLITGLSFLCCKLDTHEHVFGEWQITKAATENATGTKERTCTICDYKETDVIEKLPHTHLFAEKWTFDESYHWHAATCNHTDQVSGMAAHTWNEGEITTEATANADGVKTFTCTVCGAAKTEVIAKLSHTHNYSTSWSSDASQHWHACSDCKEKGSLANHVWDEGTITKTATAKTDGVKTYTCKVCGATKEEIITGIVTEKLKYVCAKCNKQYDTAEEAEACCKIAEEDIPYAGTVYEEVKKVAPTIARDTVTAGTDSDVTYYTYSYASGEAGSYKRSYIHTNSEEDLNTLKENYPTLQGEYTFKATAGGITVTQKLNSLYTHSTLHVLDKSVGIENVYINVNNTDTTYTYPFVTPGHTYKIWTTAAFDDWSNWWDVDSDDAFVEITATGGIGNYYLTYDSFEYDNPNYCIMFNNMKVVRPEAADSTTSFNNTTVSGNIYYNGAWNTYIGWKNSMKLTDNCLDISSIKDLIYLKSGIFMDLNLNFDFEGLNYDCKVLGKNSTQLFDDKELVSNLLTVKITGGTMEQQYQYMEASVQKTVSKIKSETEYTLPIIYVTTYNCEDVQEKEYYDCYVELFNCDEEYDFSGKRAEIKVRGNSTADSESKPYRIKFDKKQKMLGLHDGKKYKSWVLLNPNGGMDYVGFNLANKIYESSTTYDYFASDCTFVHVYINNEYKGVRLLCEQSQVGKDRVDVTELEENDGTTLDTGYFMVLDNYAWTKQKEAPAFSLNKATQISFKYQDVEWYLDKPTKVDDRDIKFQTVTHNDELYDGYSRDDYVSYTTKGYQFTDILGHDVQNIFRDWNKNGVKVGVDHYISEDQYSIKSDTYSKDQINYVAKWLNNVWEISYQAIINKDLYEMDSDHNLVFVKENPTDEEVKATLNSYIDLESLINELILEEFVRDNDVGAGSFYMAVDFTKAATEKYGRLTFECPWDFNWGYNTYSGDSEFFGDQKYYAGAYQPLYIHTDGYERSNYWFTLFNTASWFRTMVRTRWNSIPTDEITTLCDTLKTKAAAAESEGNFSVSNPVNFVKNRVTEIDSYLWK